MATFQNSTTSGFALGSMASPMSSCLKHKELSEGKAHVMEEMFPHEAVTISSRTHILIGGGQSDKETTSHNLKRAHLTS